MDEEEDEPSPVAVGVVRAELGGLWEGFLSEEMSTVGEGREERGVSMVEGRGMDGGFARPSLVTPDPLETSSFPFDSMTTSSVTFLQSHTTNTYVTHNAQTAQWSDTFFEGLWWILGK
jgi:hypothetical protein